MVGRTPRGMQRIGIILSTALALWVAAVPDISAQDAPHNPHVPSGPGPWFEGWYTRVTDVDGQRSVAVICASHLPKGQTYQPNAYLPGYLNVLLSEGNGAPTRSFVAFPRQTIRRMKGDFVRPSSDFSPPADFEWYAEGFGTVTEDSIDLLLPGEVEVHIDTTNRIPWDRLRPEAGPERYLAHLPFPLHWDVFSLGSDARYEVTLFDHVAPPQILTGQGYAHLEKNWQTEFPEGWVWAQGIAADNQAQFVASVADVKLFEGFVFQPWIVGYRSPRLQWDFRFSDLGNKATWVMDPCAGWFLLEVRDAFRVLRLYAYAPPGSYGDVAVPTQDGFVAERGGESFSTTVLAIASLRIPLRDGGEIELPIDVRLFVNAALEFGNEFACKSAISSP